MTEENGQPIPGVSISLKGTSKGTNTDINGNFKIEVIDENSILVFVLGFETQEISVGKTDNLLIKLKVNTKLLSEVVVVGYGSQKKLI